MTTLFVRARNAYTTNMSFFVLPTLTPKPKSKYIQPMSLFLAGVLMIMAVAQLFTYEDFASVLSALGFERSTGIAVVIVVAEVMSLPFLLFMNLSPAARAASMFAGWVAIGWWVWAQLISNLARHGDINSGLLGATLEIPLGWGSFFIAMALAVLCAWVSWGMWPLGRAAKK